MTLGRDAWDQDVIVLDVYLDDLLARRPAGPTALPDDTDPAIDPELVHAASAVGLALARFHPSFRFEERLAAKLRDLGEGIDPRVTPERPAEAGVVIPFGAPGQRPRTRSRRVNGAIIGGAISAGVSIASIAAGALMARRRGRGDAPWERVG